MTDLLTLTAALLLQPAAHEALDTGPQPRALRWEMKAAYRPINDEAVEFREKWSAEDQEWQNGTFLRPGRGVTETYWNDDEDWEWVWPPFRGLCCDGIYYTPQDDDVTETPELPPVPLPASVWMMLAGLVCLRILRGSRR